jgi:eukaryotic-like serine/threonine-protein kinase
MDFAVKVLSPSFPEADGPYLDRFFLEARILLSLNHPNIVRVYDVGMFRKRAYIKMELLNGQDLNRFLQERGLIDPPEAASIALAVAEGLEHAHAKKIIHRDLKPSNIFCTDEGEVRLIDFGLGAFVEGDLISRITRTG